jgi:type VI protein secretion system component Hcp
VSSVHLALDTFNFGFHNATTIGSATGGAGAGKAKFDELNVAALFSANSPVLLKALVIGAHYETAVLTQRDASGNPVAAWALGTVFVTDDGVKSGTPLPTETLTFAFGSITEATSAHSTSWSQVLNENEGRGLPDGLVLYPLSDSGPTDISLLGGTVPENQPANTSVGTFSTTDPDVGDSFTYALVSGTGDTGNTAFVLAADGVLTTSTSFDFEAQSSYSIRVRSTDVGGLSTDKVFTIGITDVNEAPTANAGGPYTVPEGGSVGLTGSGSDPDAGDTLPFAWDLDNNGTFETVGQHPTFSAAGLDGPTSRTVASRVTDASGLFANTTATVIVTNVAPTVTMTGPSTGVRYQTRTFTATATDPAAADAAAGFKYAVNWGDGSAVSTVPASANNGGGVALDHTFTATGSFTVTLTATDKDGGVSVPVTRTITIAAAALLPDPLHPGQNALFVSGTSAADIIGVDRQGSN